MLSLFPLSFSSSASTFGRLSLHYYFFYLLDQRQDVVVDGGDDLEVGQVAGSDFKLTTIIQIKLYIWRTAVIQNIGFVNRLHIGRLHFLGAQKEHYIPEAEIFRSQGIKRVRYFINRLEIYASDFFTKLGLIRWISSKATLKWEIAQVMSDLSQRHTPSSRQSWQPGLTSQDSHCPETYA